MSKGKKIPSKKGLKFTALLGTTLEKDEIKRAVAAPGTTTANRWMCSWSHYSF
jgi:hypothetical protein